MDEVKKQLIKSMRNPNSVVKKEKGEKIEQFMNRYFSNKNIEEKEEILETAKNDSLWFILSDFEEKIESTERDIANIEVRMSEWQKIGDQLKILESKLNELLK